ncbi:MAG TPA: PAS domain-containing protein, partial [Sphingomonas sp.]|nr:PAS domain-containing protein [Sphingomonas sp.]
MTILLASALPLAVMTLVAASGMHLGWPLLVLATGTIGFDALLIVRCLANVRALALRREAPVTLAEAVQGARVQLLDHPHCDADWSWRIDAGRNLVAVSPRLAYALGDDARVLEGRSFLQILAGETWESGNFPAALRTLADKIKNKECFEGLILPVTIKGETLWWEISGAPEADERGGFAGFSGTGIDVTAERHSADKINRMARYDTLTGLPNRL